ncbi:MAG TPA: ABC transporter ATP-binding protein [Lacunisphaera sp.]|jgi:putative ABC transport system ATP-binding protein
MPILSASQVTKVYRVGGGDVPALAGVSLAIERGEFVAILGTSGSGKSTLLNLFGGLDHPTSGNISFESTVLSGLNAKAMAQYRLKKIGMVFQNFNLISTMSAEQNVSLALAFAGMTSAARRERAQALLASVGLAARANHRPAELSGGEQQRVSIARALANDPQVLLADEPTGNLDSVRASEVLQILKQLQSQGKTIVLISHDHELASRFADRTVRLKDGKVMETA